MLSSTEYEYFYHSVKVVKAQLKSISQHNFNLDKKKRIKLKSVNQQSICNLHQRFLEYFSAKNKDMNKLTI